MFLTSPKSRYRRAPFGKPGLFGPDGFGVGGDAGEVLHAGVGIGGKRCELIKRQLRGSAAVGLERDFPGAFDCRNGLIGRFGEFER